MFISKAAIAGWVLASQTTAQLFLPRLLNAKQDSHISNSISFSQQQIPLWSPQGSHGKSAGLPPFEAGQFTLKPQDDTTCATYGESQWTGTIDVTDDRRLFFWFFDSRNDPKNDPVIIWLNGGPGGSSLMGLFAEMGPCWLDPNATTTVPNEFSWNNNASLLFIDQPAGVGFSSLAEGAPIPFQDADGSKDFQTFLNIFFSQVFPDRAHLPIHLAAESYGGHYAPTYLDHILESRRYDSPAAFWGNISSVILVDALIDFTGPSAGVYEFLCKNFRHGEPIMNETACTVIRESFPQLMELSHGCEWSGNARECMVGQLFAQEYIHQFYEAEVMDGKRNPFNIDIPCPDYPFCSDIFKGNITAYLNQAHILKGLGFPPSFVFNAINEDINLAYSLALEPLRTTTREVGVILDAYRTPRLGDIKLLVLQGNKDYVINTPGNLWAYNNLRWSGQADFQVKQCEELPEGLAAEGFWKGTDDGRLVFVGVDGAGHMVPGDVREGAWRIAQKWIQGGWSA